VTVELAEQFRVNEGDGSRASRRGGNERKAGGAAQVFVRSVDNRRVFASWTVVIAVLDARPSWMTFTTGAGSWSQDALVSRWCLVAS
jgi:hypothetical protein